MDRQREPTKKRRVCSWQQFWDSCRVGVIDRYLTGNTHAHTDLSWPPYTHNDNRPMDDVPPQLPIGGSQ